MGALTVGTAVYSTIGKASRWHCQCMMAGDREVFIVVKAHTAAEASEKVHRDYAKSIEYVLDILTHDQMERRKRHLKRPLLGAVSTY